MESTEGVMEGVVMMEGDGGGEIPTVEDNSRKITRVETMKRRRYQVKIVKGE
jgi:hypothetical protein